MATNTPASAPAAQPGTETVITAWPPDFAQVPPVSGARRYAVDAAGSQIRIHVFRGGRAAELGHNHVLTAPQVQAWLLWPERLADARFELRLRLDELQLDDPAVRTATGGAFAKPLSPQAVAATRVNMLGPQGLDAERYPELRLRLLEVAGEAPKLAARIAIDLHGQSHPLDVALSLREDPDGLRISGGFVLRQRDWGLQPLQVLGGLLSVQDPLLIEFDLLARPR